MLHHMLLANFGLHDRSLQGYTYVCVYVPSFARCSDLYCEVSCYKPLQLCRSYCTLHFVLSFHAALIFRYNIITLLCDYSPPVSFGVRIGLGILCEISAGSTCT